MMELKEICSLLNKKNIKYDRRGQYICVYACALGDNFYDYGERSKKLEIDDAEVRKAILLNKNKIEIIKCEDCCGCGGW